MKFGATQTVIFTAPPAKADAVQIEDYRFTFQSCSTAGSGRYWACMRDFYAWFEETYGQKNEDARKSEDEQLRNEASRLWSEANDYGAIMASLRTLETRTRQLDGEGDAASQWQEVPTPPEWANFASFVEEVPWSLTLELANAAHAVNPGVWRFQDSEAAKKKGGVNAS